MGIFKLVFFLKSVSLNIHDQPRMISAVGRGGNVAFTFNSMIRGSTAIGLANHTGVAVLLLVILPMIKCKDF